MRRAVPVLSLLVGLLATALTAPASAARAAPGPVPDVVPRPTSWTDLGGSGALSARSRIFVVPRTSGPTGNTLPAARSDLIAPSSQSPVQVATQLRTDIAEVSGLTLPVRTDAQRATAGDIVLRLTDDRALGAEGYRLDSSSAVRIEAASTHGLFYGTRTLLQLLRAAPGHRALPRARSLDVPAQRMRTVMLDAGRKYWQLPYLENLIRRMGDQKLNTLFLHLSDSEGFRLNSPKFPGLAHPAKSYSRADIERLKVFAARHHVQIMPGIDVPGHATVLTEAFGIGFGDGPDPCTQAQTHSHLTPNWMIDMTSSRALAKSREIVAEFAGWFDAPLFSIGADELPGQLAECARVKDHLAADPAVSTLGDLLNQYINTLDQVITAQGKRTAVYNGSEHMSAPQQKVNPSVVFMTWEGSGTDPMIPGHDEIAMGPFYVTPNNYHSLYPNEPWMYGTWAPSTSPDMLGSMITNWADYNFWADDEYFEQHTRAPRAVLADRSWNASPAPDTLSDFRTRLARIGDPPGVTAPVSKPRTGASRPSHHWTFEPRPYPRGWTWAGSPGNTLYAEDRAGSLPGTSYIINNPTPVADGIRGRAWRFDSDRDGVGFGGVDVAEPWTVSAWVRSTGRTADQVLLSSAAGALKLQQWGTGRVGFTRYGVADHSFDYTLPLDAWVQLTWVTTPGSTTLYADGERVGTVAASMPLPLRSIGAPKAGLRGDLDEVLTWDAALTPSQVRDRYTGTRQASGSRISADPGSRIPGA
ncbi:family 20 glycosylhydrolase [Streptomyces sp. NPDC051561]|uniref:family 20 glycosylhydrolase n=1 Tax=Streptomyces sp. NPDC051561 TaxID=3365658 RepID=UPI00379A8A95